jgi:hypothetical protein
MEFALVPAPPSVVGPLLDVVRAAFALSTG